MVRGRNGFLCALVRIRSESIHSFIYLRNGKVFDFVCGASCAPSPVRMLLFLPISLWLIWYQLLSHNRLPHEARTMREKTEKRTAIFRTRHTATAASKLSAFHLFLLSPSKINNMVCVLHTLSLRAPTRARESRNGRAAMPMTMRVCQRQWL